MLTLYLSLLTCAAVARAAVKVPNGLAVTPALGWNTWNSYACSVNEDLIIQSAQEIISLGLDKVGYEYVIIDDCWHGSSRDNTTGAPVANPTTFPGGMKNLTDTIHSLGLKAGIYSDAGLYTCGGNFGSLGYETIDAQTYAEWGFDYLKYDNCYNEGQAGTQKLSYDRYDVMAKALNATGRPILYSLCSWGDDYVWNWATTIGNSWRISGDVYDNFDRYDARCPCQTFDCTGLQGYHCSVMNIIEKAAPILQKAASGSWADMDMLEVGNGGMTFDEYVSHFSMWAALKSPLILGNKLNASTNDTLSIVKNVALLSVNQDTGYTPANRIWKNETTGLQLWSGSLANSSTVVLLLNGGSGNQTTDISFQDIFIDTGASAWNLKYNVYDLWELGTAGDYTTYGVKSMGIFNTSISGVAVRPHATRVFKLTPS